MGLCKCPKRKVTNLFCFEHRVNVCEHCLTENHPRCVVQSYLNWLKDSDYVPNCALCGISLMEGDVVRLICYDVFHTTCMEKHYKKLPPNTAPAGYKCFSCEAPVFPMPNQAGKVIDRLKDVLSNYNWARVGLGLPLIDEQPQIEAAAERTEREEEMNNHATEAPHVGGGDNPNNYGSIVRSAATQNTTLPSSSPFNPSSNSAAAGGVYSPGSRWNDTAVYKTNSNIEFVKQCIEHITAEKLQSWNGAKAECSQTPNTSMTDTNQQQQQQDLDSKAISRKLFTGQNGAGYGSYTMGEDPDGVDKYKRRSAFSWLSRWIKSRMLRGRGRETRALPRRGLVIMFIFLLFFFTFLMIMIGAGRSEDDDPNFDPHHNPMVHVDQPEFVDMGGKAVDDPLLAIQPAAGGG